MFAKARLYFTASHDALVAEGDERAAFLYVAPGDEIPDSAAEKFGLVDGNLPGDIAPALTGDVAQAILRAATMGVFGPIEVAGLTFTNEFRTFAKGDIDVAQLLAMVTDVNLVVEALQFVGDEAKDWGPIPGGEEFIRQLDVLVAAALALGGEMPRLGEKPDDAVMAAVEAAEEARKAAAANAEAPANDPPAADAAAPVTPPVTGDVAPTPATATEDAAVKEADTPAGSKEKAPAQNKEEKRGANKGKATPEAKG